ncbi:MAG: hypothetical protein ACPKPY_07355 [Nitrososphaeraceae archaeon]
MNYKKDDYLDYKTYFLKLYGQELDMNSLDKREKNVLEDIESEIECPRCHDTMTLCSDFNSLFYQCYECDFCLYSTK